MGVHEYFKTGEFVLGKLHWLELLPQTIDLTQSVIDIFGSEFDYFISAMVNELRTTRKSVCNDNLCPKPVVLSESSEVILSADAQTSTSQNSFIVFVSSWLHNKNPSHCFRKNDLSNSLCQGSRSQSGRIFLHGMPLALPFNVDISSRSGCISEVRHLPDDIQIKAHGSTTTY